MPRQQKVIIIDFGAQYAQLIARRVRELGVYTEIVPAHTSAKTIAQKSPSALILSGGPASVYASCAPSVDPSVFELGVPVLGFCYGEQLMAYMLGGSVAHAESGEYGPAQLVRLDESELLADTPEVQTVWMSHRDYVSQAPEHFTITAKTELCPAAVIENPDKKLYATQFHPEVAHTAYGQMILQNFLFRIAQLKATWTMKNFVDEQVASLRQKLADQQVILALSGGVDSAVCAALLNRAIGKNLHCVFVDHGLLRKGEPEQVRGMFHEAFGRDLIYVDAKDRYLALLQGVRDPEQKRRLIGSEFWRIFFEEAQKLGTITYLAQGTIYPDVIESGARKTGEHSSTIKSHHNLIPFPDGVHFELIEPLDHLFKDEVRKLGLELGLPQDMVYRQPFPGPGLAIRIIGDVNKEKLDILREADAIVREEIDAYNAEFADTSFEGGSLLPFENNGMHSGKEPVWQYFCVLPDIKSVGVMGDERTYESPVIIRAVCSKDAMTTDWARLPHELLARMSSRIVSEVTGINRVCYDITSKPPATIEWE